MRAKGYETLRKTVLQTAPRTGVVVAPYLTMGGTDARHFCRICANVYRFLAFSVTLEDLKGIHGMNERVSVANYAQAVRFYYQLLRNCEEL